MEILIMQVFVSLLLVLGSVILFLFTARQRDFDHADRLALLPIDSDEESSEGQ
jgi:cbb3-type cytochrome oxidase maturation protein